MSDLLEPVATAVTDATQTSFSVFSSCWDERVEEGLFRHRWTAVCEKLGARQIALKLYELAPHSKTWPYHYEILAEEWLVVVSGEPTVMVDGKDSRLRPGEIICIPAGAEGAHQVRNDTSLPARFLMFSPKADVELSVFPETGKLVVSAPREAHFVRLHDRTSLWEGEAETAAPADAGSTDL